MGRTGQRRQDTGTGSLRGTEQSEKFCQNHVAAGAVVWSASLAGKPTRPGQSPDGSLLLPLEKARGGEEAPPFVVEILYVIRGTAWEEKGKARLALPAPTPKPPVPFDL
jgi:hypothetical protein